MLEWLNKVEGSFYKAFLAEDRWKLYFAGLGVTLKVAFFAAILGLVIGTVIALMKLSTGKKGKGPIWSFIANCYIDVIRGTPSVLQLLIMWFIIMKSCKNGVLVAVLSFGINSGAYVAEIVRAGILAVDKGQTEAGRSLGLSKAQTMIYIVIPQAIKNVLPPIGNEPDRSYQSRKPDFFENLRSIYAIDWCSSDLLCDYQDFNHSAGCIGEEAA